MEPTGTANSQIDTSPMPGKRERSQRKRVHRSLYLEQDLYDRLGTAYKVTSHELYPVEVRKSAFVEACIAYALDHLPEIKTVLHENV